MITKDQLNLLKQSLRQKQEMHLTPGGTVEATVNSHLRQQKIQKYDEGKKVISKASSDFRREIREKSKQGLPKSNNQSFPKEVPRSDRKVAERTWDRNHLENHKGKLKSSQDNFRSSVRSSFNPKVKSR